MLDMVVESLDEVPAEAREHYNERDGKFELDVTGAFSQIDRDTLQGSLAAERTAHGLTKGKLRSFGEDTPETIAVMRDEHTQRGLDLEAHGSGDDEAIEQRVESRIVARIAPSQREVKRLGDENATLKTEIGDLKGLASKSKIKGVVSDAFGDKRLGSVPSAIVDVNDWAAITFTEDESGAIVSRDGLAGIAPGLAPFDVLSDVRTANSRPHWFKPTKGGGLRDSSKNLDTADNPFEIVKDPKTGQEKVTNLTKAGQIINSDRALAKRLAEQAKSKHLFPGIF